MVARLGSAEVRARIAADVRDGLPGWPNYIVATGGWDGIRIAAVVDPALAWLEGQTDRRGRRRARARPVRRSPSTRWPPTAARR